MFKYEDAGVSITRGNQFVNDITKEVESTFSPLVISKLGGFSSLFDVSFLKDYDKPVLVSSTDGVGTKLKLAAELGNFDTIGIDLVAMSVNDIITSGATPLFFLDYIAIGKLELITAKRIISSIAKGCKEANVSLIGGETAEMPGIYKDGDFDLAGFCIGVVEKDKIVDGSSIVPGDVLIGLPSSGLHSNGYSLVRKILKDVYETKIRTLMLPTKIYVNTILKLLEKINIKGMAHITGGGFDNVARMTNLPCYIDYNSWELPPIFKWLRTLNDISLDELHRTFNCGIGFVVCVSKDDVTETLNFLTNIGEKPIVIGYYETSKKES